MVAFETYPATIYVITPGRVMAEQFDRICGILHYGFCHLHTISLEDWSQLSEATLIIIDAINHSSSTVEVWRDVLATERNILWVVPDQTPSFGQQHLLRSPFSVQQAISVIQRIIHDQTSDNLSRSVSDEFLHQLMRASSHQEILKITAQHLQQVLPCDLMGVLTFDEALHSQWIYWSAPAAAELQQVLEKAVNESQPLPAGWDRLPLNMDDVLSLIFVRMTQPFTTTERQKFYDLTRLTAKMWFREYTLQHTRKRVAEMRVYDLINRSILGQTDPHEIMQTIVASARGLTDAASVVLWLRRKNHLVAVASTGQPTPTQRYLSIENHWLHDVMEKRQPLIQEPDSDMMHLYQSQEIAQSLCVPLMTRTRVIGLIQGISVKGSASFTVTEEWHLRHLASWSVLAINNAELHHRTLAALQRERAYRHRLVEAEKLTALGRLVASVAHEVNNPLQIAQSALEMSVLQEKHTMSPNLQENMRVVQESIDQIGSIIDNLRSTYRTTDEVLNVDINDIVQRTGQMVHYNLKEKQIHIHYHLAEPLPRINCVPQHLRQVFLNLLLNAIDAIENTGVITISTEHDTQANEIITTIQDTGHGIPEDLLATIFEPFFTTRRKGSGLGLAISQDIVRQHGGRISAVNLTGSGCKFMVCLPVPR